MLRFSFFCDFVSHTWCVYHYLYKPGFFIHCRRFRQTIVSSKFQTRQEDSVTLYITYKTEVLPDNSIKLKETKLWYIGREASSLTDSDSVGRRLDNDDVTMIHMLSYILILPRWWVCDPYVEQNIMNCVHEIILVIIFYCVSKNTHTIMSVFWYAI